MSRKRSILIVEDEIIIAKDLERILLNEGYNVLGIISSGEEAIKQAIELQPDLVLLDITLSDNISGIDVASVIQFHQIPVIYITAFSDKRNIKGIIDSGSYGYVLKPYNNEELITTIEIALSRHKTYKKIKESENRYRTLFANMQNGLAYHKIITNEDETPIDYIFLNINDSFEWLTGLKRENIIGKRVTEVLPGIENDPSGWIEKYGKVALTGRSVRFENFSTNFKKWFSVNAYSPQKGYFVTIFEDITERKHAEEELQKTEKHFVKVIENIFKFVPEGLLVFTDKINLAKQNKAFQDIVKKYAVKLKYTEPELTEIIIEQVKKRIINEDYADIRIPKNKNKK
ncbi:MAG: response regulator [Candidatus Cloacimonadales bacterium]|nr:response regulator [Candidatus Cloacimonadales bacterium]